MLALFQLLLFLPYSLLQMFCFPLSCLIVLWKWLLPSQSCTMYLMFTSWRQHSLTLLFFVSILHARRKVTEWWPQGPPEPVLEPPATSPNDLNVSRRKEECKTTSVSILINSLFSTLQLQDHFLFSRKWGKILRALACRAPLCLKK